MVGSSIIADAIRGWLGRKDALEEIPFAVVLLEPLMVVSTSWADFVALAMKSVWRYDPIVNSWSEVAPMSIGRAYCKTGVLNNKLYVVGGEVYDPETNSWVEMPVGMGEGWPAKQAGTKLSVIVDGELYALDPSSSLDSARIKVYDDQDDSWKTIEGDVPIRDLADSESPYLLAGFLGKLHVITKDVNHNISVMQAGRENGLDSGPSTSSTIDENLRDLSGNLSASLGNLWKVIANRSAGSAELVSCQILDI
ncbi:hypothetical protein DH2020_030889 [Rehmannia glutinosa]|uniref:F-box/kelch-repeat protein n=1 Tax=Rehmannia glutinosa TaxID=99300 RepID=A0ABR0VL99_REHGL